MVIIGRSEINDGKKIPSIQNINEDASTSLPPAPNEGQSDWMESEHKLLHENV